MVAVNAATFSRENSTISSCCEGKSNPIIVSVKEFQRSHPAISEIFRVLLMDLACSIRDINACSSFQDVKREIAPISRSAARMASARTAGSRASLAALNSTMSSPTMGLLREPHPEPVRGPRCPFRYARDSPLNSFGTVE